MSELGIHVLHVDDDPDFADVTADLLEREDERLTVETATSANEGSERLTSGEFDCVVSDYDMPKQNGIEFLETVRETYPDLPFILYTGRGSEVVASRASSAGCTDYLQKTSGTDQHALLANKITNYVEKYDAEQKMAHRARAMETANEGIALIDSDGKYVEMNETYADLYGTDTTALIGEEWTITVPDEEAEGLRTDAFPKAKNGESWTGRAVGQCVDGSTYEKFLSLAPLDDGGHVCVVRDISEKMAREQAIEALHETAREFMRAETPEAVADIAVTAVRDVIGLQVTGLYLYDDQGERLHPVAWTEMAATLIGDLPTFEAGDSIAWETFDTGDAQIYDDVSTVPARYNHDTVIRSQITLPLADHGVLLIGSPEASKFDETDVDLARTLATHARTALDRIESEQEFNRTATRLKLAVEGANLGVWDWDLTTDEVEFNEQWAEMLGYSLDEIEPHVDAWEKRVHPDDLDDVTEMLEAHLNGETAYYEFDHRMRTAEGDWKWIRDLGKVAERDDNDEPVRVVGIYLDIDERKQRQRALEQRNTELANLTDQLEQQYRTLFEEAPMMAVVTRNEQGTPIIEDCNDQFIEAVGYNKDAVVDRELAEFYTPEAQERLLEQGGYERALEDDSTKEHRDLLTADGDIVNTLLRAVPRRDDSGEVVGTVAMYLDITEQEEVKRANEHLEKFTGIVSHDLRNPLTVAEGRLELAKQECDSEHLQHVERAHNRMNTLIENLLTLAREGEAVTDISQIDLPAMIKDCWTNTETAEATLVTDIDRLVQADKTRLKQVFENLFRNAIEHGGENVTVTIGRLADGFYIDDDGPGIPPTVREEVFDAGYSTNEEGTGFGLSIVEQIITAHGWEIHVTEGADNGARFEITGVEVADE